jgi:hypothetical protein
MKAYLISTGGLFGLITLVHLWRIVDEWPRLATDARASFSGRPRLRLFTSSRPPLFSSCTSGFTTPGTERCG